MDENFSSEEKEELLKVKDCYDKMGTIYGAAKTLNMQDWRVRKCLRKGHWYRLFYYDKFNKKTKLLSKKKYLSKRIKKYSSTSDGAMPEFQLEQNMILLQKVKEKEGHIPIEKTLLSNRARNALINAGYQTLEECQNLSWEDLRSIRNIGEKTIEEIQGLLKRFKKEQKSTQSKDVPGSNGDEAMLFLVEIFQGSPRFLPSNRLYIQRS